MAEQSCYLKYADQHKQVSVCVFVCDYELVVVDVVFKDMLELRTDSHHW